MGATTSTPPPADAGKHLGNLRLGGSILGTCGSQSFRTGCLGGNPKGPEWDAVKRGLQKYLDEVDGHLKEVPRSCCGEIQAQGALQALTRCQWLPSVNQYLQQHNMVSDIASFMEPQKDRPPKEVLKLRFYMLKGSIVGQPIGVPKS